MGFPWCVHGHLNLFYIELIVPENWNFNENYLILQLFHRPVSYSNTSFGLCCAFSYPLNINELFLLQGMTPPSRAHKTRLDPAQQDSIQARLTPFYLSEPFPGFLSLHPCFQEGTPILYVPTLLSVPALTLWWINPMMSVCLSYISHFPLIIL